MINLLPPNKKQALFIERTKKLVIILGNMLVISLICLVLVLLFIKFYILIKSSYQKDILSGIEKKYQNPDTVALKGSIKKYNANLAVVDDFYKKEVYFSNTLKTISNVQRPVGVYLTGITIENVQNKLKASVSGFSDTRDNLIIFKDNIDNTPQIKNVYFPPDSWIKSQNVNFNLTFEVSPAN